jgi:hypothetical protein
MVQAAFRKIGMSPIQYGYINYDQTRCCGLAAISIAKGCPKHTAAISDANNRINGTEYACGFETAFDEKSPSPLMLEKPDYVAGYEDGRDAAKVFFGEAP